VNVEIKVDSITTDNEGRDQHLRSADFFEIESYPTLSFTSTAFRAGSGTASSSMAT